MSKTITPIDTQKIEFTTTLYGGTKEVLNESLAGAKLVVAKLHRINPGMAFTAVPLGTHHQCLRILNGRCSIDLAGTHHQGGQDDGVYLGPGTTACFWGGPSGAEVFHEIVLEMPH